MASFLNNNRFANNNAPAQREQARGFINLYFVDPNGRQKKISGVPLNDSNPFEKMVREWLEADPENLGLFMESLTATYVPNTGGTEMVLPKRVKTVEATEA